MGDWNAKVGKDSNLTWPTTVGKLALGTINISGEKLLQFCSINNLSTTNTMYKHKTSGLVTWISPDGKARNQIDYILIKNDMLKDLKNCRVFNSADIGSDHSLLLCKILIQLKTYRNKLKLQPRRFDVEKLNIQEFA